MEFILSQTKHEIYRKSLHVSFYLLIKDFGLNSIQFGNIPIDHDVLFSDEENPLFNH